MKNIKLKSLGAIVGLLAGSLLVLAPGNAGADPTVVTCAGSAQVSYSPGLTFTTQTTTVSFSENFGTCADPGDPAIVSATAPIVQSVQQRSCATLLEIPPVAIEQTVTWNTGETSTFSYTPVVNNVGGVVQVTGTGTVSSGKYAGAAVTKLVVLQNVNILACFTPGGLTSVSGTDSLTFTTL